MSEKLFKFNGTTQYRVLGPDDQCIPRDLSELEKEELIKLCQHMMAKVDVLETERKAIVMTMNKFLFKDKESLFEQILEREMQETYIWS